MATFNTFAINFERSDWWPKDFTALNPLYANYEAENENMIFQEDEHGVYFNMNMFT